MAEIDVDISLLDGKSEERIMAGNQQSGEDVSPADVAAESQSEEVSAKNDQFVGRVASYPVVASTLGKVMDLYSKCKESNELVKYSLESAESGVKYVSNTVAPVVTKLERPLSTVNSVACSGLDLVEEKCPIIQKPTDEVIAETKNVYETKVKPSVDKVTGIGQYAADTCVGVKDYGVTKVSDATNYTTEKIGMVRDVSYEKIGMIRDKSYETFNAALATPTGQSVLDKIDAALTTAESYVDHYLPEKTDDEKAPEDMEVDEAEQQARPVAIYGKARHRLYAKAMEKLNNVQLRTKETLERFNFTVNLLDYAKVNLSAANERVSSSLTAAREKGMYWWDEISKDEDNDVDESLQPENSTMESQALKVARNLTRQIRHSLHSLNEKAIPEHLRERYTAAKQYSVELAGSFLQVTRLEELSDSVMTRAREQADYIQDTMTSMAEVAADKWPLNQVTPDFVIDDLGDTDGEETDENDNDIE